MYRHNTKYVIIAQIGCLVPKDYVFPPFIYGGGSSALTWETVSRFYRRYPRARLSAGGIPPMHLYTEFLGRQYATFVGCPSVSRSWWLQEMVELKALDIVHTESILVVLQESYHIEVMEKELWKHLANFVITPIMRELKLDRSRIMFYENIVDREVVEGKDFPYLFHPPTYLDPFQLEMWLKKYGKR